MESDSNRESDRKFMALESALTYGGHLAGRGMRYVFYYIFARALGAGGVGLYSLGTTVVSIAGIFTILGFDYCAVRYVSVYKSDADGPRMKGTILLGVLLSFFTGLTAAAAVFVLGRRMAVDFFRKPEFSPVLRLIIWALPLYGVLIILVSVLQGLGKMRLRVLCEEVIRPAVLALGVGVLAAFYRVSVMAGVLIYIAALFIASATAAAMVYRNTAGLMGQGPPRIQSRELARYAYPLFLRSFFAQFIMWIDMPILGRWRSSAEVGIYFIAGRVSILPDGANRVIGSVVSPMMAEQHHLGDKQRLRDLFTSATRWIAMFEFPIILFLAVCAKQVMVLFGHEFHGGVQVLWILLVGQTFIAFTGAVMPMLLMCGYSDWALVNTVIGAILSVGLDLWWIPRYGIAGAAAASSVVKMAVRSLAVIEIWKLEGMQPFTRSFFSPIGAGLLAAGLLAVLRLMVPVFETTVSGLGISLVVFLLAFVAGLLVFGLDPEDRKLIAFWERRHESDGNQKGI